MGFTLNDLLVFILTFAIGLSIAPIVYRLLKICFKTIVIVGFAIAMLIITLGKGIISMPSLQEWNRRMYNANYIQGLWENKI